MSLFQSRGSRVVFEGQLLCYFSPTKKKDFLYMQHVTYVNGISSFRHTHLTTFAARKSNQSYYNVLTGTKTVLIGLLFQVFLNFHKKLELFFPRDTLEEYGRPLACGNNKDLTFSSILPLVLLEFL